MMLFKIIVILKPVLWRGLGRLGFGEAFKMLQLPSASVLSYGRLRSKSPYAS